MQDISKQNVRQCLTGVVDGAPVVTAGVLEGAGTLEAKGGGLLEVTAEWVVARLGVVDFKAGVADIGR